MLPLNREQGTRFAEAETLRFIAYSLHRLGDLVGAAEHYRMSVKTNSSTGDRYGIAKTLVSLGEVHLDLGNVDEAREAWTEALTMFEDLAQPDADGVRAKLTALSAASASG